MLNLERIAEYESIFGRDKMKFLFDEFIKSADEGFIKLEKADENEARIVVHSIKSAAKVFGMDEFANICGEIENKLVEGEKIRELEFLIKSAKMLYNEQLEEFKRIF